MKRIFVAGGTGAIGKRLVPCLAAAGHQVVATTRTAAKIHGLQAAGAEPVVLDVLDRQAVLNAVAAARPDVVIHQVTALATMPNLRKFDQEFAATNRLRVEGTDHLLEAARAAGATRFVAQSFTGWPNAREGGRIKSEIDRLDAAPPEIMRSTLDAIRHLETAVVSESNLTGIVLRYGALYGPGSGFASDGDVVRMIRRRMFPMFGEGRGVWSFVHVDDAAEATELAIERGRSGLYNIVDDEPAEVSVWLPDLARAIGAKSPFRLPAWMGRLAIGDAGMSMMTRVRGSSNAKAKRELGWRPRYPTWRDGFRRGLGERSSKI